MEVTILASLCLSPQFLVYKIAPDLLSWLEEGSFKDLHLGLSTIIALTP